MSRTPHDSQHEQHSLFVMDAMNMPGPDRTWVWTWLMVLRVEKEHNTAHLGSLTCHRSGNVYRRAYLGRTHSSESGVLASTVQSVHIFCNFRAPPRFSLLYYMKTIGHTSLGVRYSWTKLTRPHRGDMFRMRLACACRFSFPFIIYGSARSFLCPSLLSSLETNEASNLGAGSEGLKRVNSRPHSNLMRK